MADQKRWFKFHNSALSDDRIQSLPTALRWAWVALGSHTALHGENGRVSINPANAVLAAQMGVAMSDLGSTIKRLPHVRVEEGRKRDDEIIVTWDKWHYYQVDSGGAERMRMLRSQRRREEKRGDEKRDPPHKPPKGATVDDGFDAFWLAYPSKKRLGKPEARKAWRKLKPSPERRDQIMRSLEAWKRSEGWSKESGKYIPWPQKFLNKGRYEDTPEPAEDVFDEMTPPEGVKL